MADLTETLKSLLKQEGFLNPRIAAGQNGHSWLAAALPYLPAANQARRFFGLFACRNNYALAVEKLKKARKAAANYFNCAAKSMRIICNSQVLNEKALAASCGVGFYGKNSLILVPKWGSFCVLAALEVPAELPADPPLDREVYNCGSCSACSKACPTNALHKSYRLDVKLCAQAWASWGIEAKDPLKSKRSPIIYGCDLCQNCCPKNKQALHFYQDQAAQAPQEAWTSLQLWLEGDAAAIEKAVKKSPLGFNWLNKQTLIANARSIVALGQDKIARQHYPDLPSKP